MDYSELHSLWLSSGFNTRLSKCLVVDSTNQRMIFYKHKRAIKSFIISSAKNGLGNQQGSYQTPHGFFQIAEKIGGDQPINMLFKSRKPTGECALINSEYATKNDTIMTRILWLSGLQKGINLEGDVDTKNRYIYIHGTADEENLGKPASHGCIRMKNTDIINLYDDVDNKTIVYIY
ncbi:MAG: L,D-transpeptidase [Gammaproteobacteria bacterium]|nr:L,D-transpeptidase [Gammaproteobacteria bacterium]